MNILAQQFEDSPLDQAITFLVVAPVQITLGVSWEVGKLAVAVARLTRIVLTWLFAALTENWQIVGKLAAIVAITLFVVTQPQITITALLIVGFAKFTKP
jgi:hypothetical protein